MPRKRVHENVGQAAGAGVVVQTRERVGLWVELHSRERECILRSSTFHYKFQECAVQLPTINKKTL